ncbi:hypothetical protein HDU99_008087, partial [Rhizoclosmatium hyalinum]
MLKTTKLLTSCHVPKPLTGANVGIAVPKDHLAIQETLVALGARVFDIGCHGSAVIGPSNPLDVSERTRDTLKSTISDDPIQQPDDLESVWELDLCVGSESIIPTMKDAHRDLRGYVLVASDDELTDQISCPYTVVHPATDTI